MNTHFLYLFVYITAVYLAGFVFLAAFFSSFIAKHTLFTIVGISWAVGNFIAVFFLSILAFANKLAVFTFFNLFIFAAVLLGILAVLIYQKRKIVYSVVTKSKKINLLVVLLILIFFYPLLQNALFSYLIDWDAVAFWFFKAKAFFYAGGVWHAPFFENASFFSYAHKAYPIGFPLLIAGYYQLIGAVNDQAVRFYIVLFYLNLVFVFYGFVREYIHTVSWATLLLITVSLLIFPYLIIYSHNGYADVALSFIFTLCTILFIYGHEIQNRGEKIRYGVLMVIISALGATIKNEGSAFFGVTLGAVTFLLFFQKIPTRQRLSVKRIIIAVLFFTAIFLPIGLWQYFKFINRIETDSYLANAQLYRTIIARIKLIFNLYLNEVINTSKYGILLIPSFFIFIVEYTLLIAAKKIRFLLPSLLTIVQLGGYTFIYAITNVPLDWQVLTSFDRLLLHLIPSYFIVAVYQLKPAIEVIGCTLRSQKERERRLAS